MVRLFDVEFWIVCGDFEQFPVEVLPYLCGNDSTTVFGRKDNVVVAQIDAMAHSSVLMWLGHTFIVP